MKKVLYFVLMVVMLMMPIGALAEGETVTAEKNAFVNVPFSNGYTGFCIDDGKKGANIDDQYMSAQDTTVATHNDTGKDISQYLKIIFTQNFETLFVSDGNGGYVIDKNLADSHLGFAIYHFSDDQYVYSTGKTLVESAKNYDKDPIPDHGYTLTVNEDTITFHFIVLEPIGDDVESRQSFFAYKIEVKKAGECNHTGGEADCETPAICDICKEPYGEVDKTNHTGETEVKDQKEATTEKPGYTGDTYCKGCGELLEEGEEIPKVHVHEYSEDWKSNDNGHWKECECGKKDDVNDHTGGEADCETPAICDTCKKTYGDVDKTNHTGETEVKGQKEATTEAPGYTGDTHCKDCGELLEKGEEIPQLLKPHEHKYSENWKSDEENHWRECECGDKSDVKKHTGGEADCETPKICEVCEKLYGEPDDKKHSGETEVKNKKPATEKEPGYTGDVYCKACGDLLEKGKEIPKLNKVDGVPTGDDTNVGFWCLVCAMSALAMAFAVFGKARR